MKKEFPYILDYYDREITKMISQKYNFSMMDAYKKFIFSETYKMLCNIELKMWDFSCFGIFDMWEAEQITGNPRNSLYIRRDWMNKEMEFFIFLIEQYAFYKNTNANVVLSKLEKYNLTNFVYDMYEIYHTEAIENAFENIDNLIEEKSKKFVLQ